MQRLDPANGSGFFKIDGQPYQRGSVKVTYGTDTLTVRDDWGIAINGVNYAALTNTGFPFPSMAALRTFVEANFFAPSQASVAPDARYLPCACNCDLYAAEYQLAQRYADKVAASPADAAHFLEFAATVRSFWHKLHTVLPFFGSTVPARGYNLVNPTDGPEGFHARIRGAAALDAEGILLPQGGPTTGSVNTLLNPKNVRDYRNLGITFATPDTVGGGDWMLACLGDDNLGIYNHFTYHPNYLNTGNDYVILEGSPLTIPTVQRPGLTSLRRGRTAAKITVNGVMQVLSGVGYETWDDDQYNYCKIAALANTGGPYRLSFLAITEGLTDAEDTILTRAANTLLARLGRNTYSL